MVDFQSRDTRGGDVADDGSSEAGGNASGSSDEEGGGETDGVETREAGEGDDVLGFAVLTVGSERSIADDTTGEAVVRAVGDVGEVVTREVIDDRFDGIQSTVGSLAQRGDVDVLVTVGGTGPEPGDVTVDAVTPLLDKRLTGVGELIRRTCFGDDPTAAVRTRAMGGTLDGVPVFCLPGDPAVARAAAVEVVVPEAPAVADLASRPPAED